MKFKNKLIFAVIIISIVLLNFISCKTETAKENPGNTNENSVSEPEKTSESAEEIKDNVPEIDFEGKTFSMLIPEQTWASPHIIQEEINGDIINDAQYLLKTKIEERFNLILKETVTADIWGTSYISKLINGGDDTYSVFFPLDLYVVQYAQKKQIYNWDDLKYVDLTKPYWDSSMNKNITINHKTFFAFGAYDLSYYDQTHILVFNKDLIKNYGLETPYEYVKSGKWTLDKFAEMGKKTTFDVNGDGVMDEEDSYGFISQPKQIPPSFWMAAGELSVSKDENDYPRFNIPGNERFFSVMDRLYAIMWDEGIWCRNEEYANAWSKAVPVFSENRSLFAAQTFYYLNDFRVVDADFGIVPYPKFTESQKQYYSRVEGGCKMAIVPVTNPSPEKAGAVLEAMACESYKIVIPQYYEIALKRKNSRDEESEGMLDLIFSTRVYDLGDTWWCNELRDGIFKPMFTKNDRAIMSKMESFEPKMNGLIEKTIAGFED